MVFDTKDFFSEAHSRESAAKQERELKARERLKKECARDFCDDDKEERRNCVAAWLALMV